MIIDNWITNLIPKEEKNKQNTNTVGISDNPVIFGFSQI
jgi:hypothetical protein